MDNDDTESIVSMSSIGSDLVTTTGGNLDGNVRRYRRTQLDLLDSAGEDLQRLRPRNR